MKAWKRDETEGKLKIALLTALIAAGSQIAIPLPLVPVNLALLFVLLAGLILPWRRAVAAVCLFLLMGLTGIPVFAAFRGGPQVLLGPSGGFLMGYLFAAGTVSALQGWAHCYSRRFFICILAVLACYMPGALWLIFLMGKPIPEILSVAVLRFLPGDLLKSLAAPALVQRLEKALVFRSFNVKTSASSPNPPRP